MRIENGLVMIDFDIDAAALMNEIIDTMPQALWSALGACPVRQGNGTKEAWFARIEKPFLRLASAECDGTRRVALARADLTHRQTPRPPCLASDRSLRRDRPIKRIRDFRLLAAWTV